VTAVVREGGKDVMEKATGRRDSSARQHEVDLPEGVTVADWALERVRVQNPSIRPYLGCIRLLEEVLDSNYAILHCSPERLSKIWHQVEQVAQLVRSELLPTLEAPSIIPGLDAARRNARTEFRKLADTALAGMERCGLSLRAEHLPEVRKVLCVSLGKIYAFLRDTFGEIVANDPRSRHDADYFLSRRFAQDIEESEWLYSSVYELYELLVGLEKACSVELEVSLQKLRKERMVPADVEWEPARKLLDNLLGDLIPKVNEVLSLRGIRLNDMESLEGQASAISAHCRSLIEVYTVGTAVIQRLKGVGGPTLGEREQRVKDLIACHWVVSGRMAELLTRLLASLRDLVTHNAASKDGIEKRRALVLAKDLGEFRPRAHRPVRRIR
jgi:hypothetical protein